MQIEQTSLEIEKGLICTYYPSTRQIMIEDKINRECIVLNFTSLTKVYQWLRQVTRNREK